MGFILSSHECCSWASFPVKTTSIEEWTLVNGVVDHLKCPRLFRVRRGIVESACLGCNQEVQQHWEKAGRRVASKGDIKGLFSCSVGPERGGECAEKPCPVLLKLKKETFQGRLRTIHGGGALSLHQPVWGLNNCPEPSRTKVGSGHQCPESVPRSESHQREAVRANEFIAKANI